MNILGISCFYHDSAACLVIDGKVVAACAEERFSREKHDSDFPIDAAMFCLLKGGLSMSEVDYVVFYEKPLLKFERLLMSYGATYPASLPQFLKSMPIWVKKKMRMRKYIREVLNYNGTVLFLKHHLSHAASAFFQSGFDSAAILTVDAVGEWSTTGLWRARGSQIVPIKELAFPHSLGMLYSAFTYFLGFRVNSGEYKVMGLAPKGNPRYVQLIMEHLIDVKADGSFNLNMKYFTYHRGMKMIGPAFEKLFNRSARVPESEIEVFHCDIASSIQAVTNDIMLRLCATLHRETNEMNLCLAGGVAMNCVANGVLAEQGLFRNIFVQPECGDAGGALGAALYCHRAILENQVQEKLSMPFYGPNFSDYEIANYLSAASVGFEKMSEEDLYNSVAKMIADGKVVGWFQGASEFGPRALGNRSILADPRRADMQAILNSKIKMRENFRPFAPVVLEEKAADWFTVHASSPHMMFVVNVLQEKREKIPSVTHLDGTARFQTVNVLQNPHLYRLIQRFDEITGVPILVNTSFNIRSEPIVNTPGEALRCFMRTGLDALVMGNYLVREKNKAVPRDQELEEVFLD